MPLNHRAATSKWERKTSECGKIRSGSSLYPSVISALTPAESRVTPTPFARLVSADPRGSSCEYPRPHDANHLRYSIDFGFHGSWGDCRREFLIIDVFQVAHVQAGMVGISEGRMSASTVPIQTRSSRAGLQVRLISPGVSFCAFVTNGQLLSRHLVPSPPRFLSPPSSQ